MEIGKVIRRFVIPSVFISLYYWLKFGCKISPCAEVEFSSNLRIGRNTNIGSFSKIKVSDGPLTIGKNVSIGAGCNIGSGEKGIVIGDDCLIGPHVNIIGNNYRYGSLDVPLRLQGNVSKGTRIGNNVWIGAGACILDGTVIGNGVIISPNSVVSATVPDNAILQGNPAKVIFTRR
jgi:acetyltransferase-like isoleucine patch superfamily enzyme